MLYEIHFSSHVTIQSRNGSLLLHRIREEDTSKRCGFFFLLFFVGVFGQHMRHPLTELFHLSNLLQMLNDHRMVDTEFFDNISGSC